MKRCKVENIGVEDFHIGGTFNLLSRQLTVVDFGDDYTKNKLTISNEKFVEQLLYHNIVLATRIEWLE